MTIKQLRDDFYAATGTLSDNTRKLAFSGIAIVWIFTKLGDNNEIKIPEVLESSLYWLVLALIIDILQYVWQSIVLKIILEIRQKQFGKKDDTEIEIPRINEIAWLFFLAKVVVMGIGFWKILQYLGA